MKMYEALTRLFFDILQWESGEGGKMTRLRRDAPARQDGAPEPPAPFCVHVGRAFRPVIEGSNSGR